MKIHYKGQLIEARLVKAVEGKRGDYYLLEQSINYKGKERKKIYLSEMEGIKVFKGK